MSPRSDQPGGRSRHRRSEWARWGLLATTLSLGIALIATTWASHRSAVQGSFHLALGQAETMLRAVRRDLEGVHGPPSTSHLATILERHGDAGLLLVTVLDHRGRIVGLAGEQALSLPEPIALPKRGELGWSRADGVSRLIRPFDQPGPAPRPSRVRGGSRRPPSAITGPRERPPKHRPADTGARRPGARPRSGPRPGGPREGPPSLFLSLTIQANTAQSLTQQTANVLAIATASAVLLTLAGSLFWRQARANERAQRQLEQQDRLRAIGEMSAVLAHEIRNPLASLKGHAQLLAENVGPEHTDGPKIARIVREATRLEQLTTDLLDFSRSDSLDRSSVDPVGLVESCAQEIDGDRIQIRAAAAPSRWSLDDRRMRQVLVNLLRNAVQATEASEMLTPSIVESKVEVLVDVTNQPSAPTLRIRIRNPGDGLPAGHENTIFEPFFTTRARGTGLGLAVARRIVELHGGTLIGRNPPEGGAELEARIPQA